MRPGSLATRAVGEDRLPVGINRRDAAPTPTGLAEIISVDFFLKTVPRKTRGGLPSSFAGTLSVFLRNTEQGIPSTK
jgi:hypothetical protein